LSNLANGGYRKIVVLTQYKSHSLDVHISRTLAAQHAPRQLRHRRFPPRCAGGHVGSWVRPTPCSRT
jgi:ADP-glucose pyrophosphorylase